MLFLYLGNGRHGHGAANNKAADQQDPEAGGARLHRATDSEHDLGSVRFRSERESRFDNSRTAIIPEFGSGLPYIRMHGSYTISQNSVAPAKAIDAEAAFTMRR